ncbi:MAG TPA: hypothetical protein VHZ07_26005 [Bryobacteraceae bacterium]|jgi:hypothetical protein|nr:hypothetical protein [Bryobacteraceae bacterium]
MNFESFHNTIGLAPVDLIEIGLAALLLFCAFVWGPWIQPFAVRFMARTLPCMIFLAALPIALRLLLLPHHAVPAPGIYDEFGHLLVADTLRHLRLANPPHPLPQFFETFFVLQRPTYSSIYPLGQGIALAIGWTIFGLPWVGVLLSTGAFCALAYWMLRAWITPGWALLGGLLAVMEFGPLSMWMNSYWGGSFAAAAGCLVYGALPRLMRHPRKRYAGLLGLGIGAHLLTRPYESIFLLVSIALFLPPALKRSKHWRLALRPMLAMAVAMLPAITLILLQNHSVTGSWTTLPYSLSQYQYGVPASLTLQRPVIPHNELTPQQALDYRMQRSFQSGPETIGSYLLRLEYRVRFYRFFFLPPLYLALAAFVVMVRGYRDVWVILTLLLFALGVNFFPAFQFHYLAGVTGLFLFVSVAGLERLSRWRSEVAVILVVLCVAQFLLWYGMHAFEGQGTPVGLASFETWDVINHGNPERRIKVKHQLANISGKLLVFVRYSPHHIFQDEWVYNAADIDNARIVWARDLGPEEDRKLIAYYPRRTVLLLEPDERPPDLEAYDQ